ncbi:MAG: radical SAM protein [Candidatus Thorarchaeota archaeon]
MSVIRNSPSEIIFFVTNKCNSQCKGCLYWPKLNNKKFKDLTFNEIKKIFTPLHKVKRILISGGEPYLRNDFVEICIFFNKKNIDFLFIPTNGILTKKILDQTKKILDNFSGYIKISVSIDGTNEIYKKLRRKNTFRNSLNTLSGLIDLKKEYPNLSVGVSTRILNLNLQNIGKLILYLRKNYDLDFHFVFPIRGKLKEKYIKPPTQEQYKKISKINIDLYKGINKFMQKTFDCLIMDLLFNRQWPFKCVAGKYNGVIESDGAIRLCEILEPIGSLRGNSYNFDKIWNSRKSNVLRRIIKEGNCSKGCTHGCFLRPSFFVNPYELIKYSIKGIRL